MGDGDPSFLVHPNNCLNIISEILPVKVGLYIPPSLVYSDISSSEFKMFYFDHQTVILTQNVM